jgi:uncharacterized protein (PEP-CTERM system associated)
MAMVMVMVMVMVMDMKNNFSTVHPISGMALFFLVTTAFAQQGMPGSTITNTINNGDVQNSSNTRTWLIQPRLSLTETLTDNFNINGNTTGKQSDLITEINPGVLVDANTARLKAHFDYTLRGQYYAQHSDYSRFQNALNSFGTYEAIDSWLYLDFSGVVAQQAVSAFAPQSSSTGTVNNNSKETTTFRISPYIRGQFAGLIEYNLRYNTSTTHSGAAGTSDVNLTEWAGQLVGSTPFQSLKWTLEASQQTADYSTGRNTESTRSRILLNYAFDPQFRLLTSAGLESNNYASAEQESKNTYGVGFNWNPTDRTQFSLFKEHRFFGNGHNVSFNHRFRNSSIRFSDTKDISLLPNQFTSGGQSTIYQIYYQQAQQQFPDLDSSALTAYVNNLLAQNGINPNQQITSGFLTSQASIQRSQQLTLALFGARNTLSLMFNRNESQSMLAAPKLNDDLSQSNEIRQNGISVNVAHQLTPFSSLNLLASRQNSKGSGAVTQESSMNLYNISITSKLGQKTTGSVLLRHSEFDSTTTSYTENAIVGTISMIF